MAGRPRHEARTAIVASLRDIVRGLDAEVLEPASATALVEWFAEVERLAAAGKALAARRVETSGAWRASGERSAADWLAARTGSTLSDARRALEVAAHVEAAPKTDDALRAGALTLQQAEAVGGAAASDPAAETRLLEIAAHQSLQKLRDEAARVRAAAEPDPVARHRRIHRSRYWRRWTDVEGARCGQYRLTPEAAAIVEAAAQPFIDAAIDLARASDAHEASEAYAADGLVGMARALHGDDAGLPRGGRGRRRLTARRELIAIADIAALRRGSVQRGETCEIAGVGPVPVDVAREVFGDALLRIVIRDGVDIRTVVHTGRTASTLQETAVLVREGGRCARPTCGRPIAEIDHIEGFARTKQTTLDDLAGLCAHDHDLKTLDGHTYGRLDDGAIEWRTPDGAVERSRPP
jgi:hypothetical protein